jgi:uncharacterized protein YcfJ
MKRSMLCRIFLSGVMFFSGVGFSHAQETKTGAGALVGGLLGAVAGSQIGKHNHNATGGALIGGAVGALGGAVVGSQMKSEAKPSAASQDTGYRPVDAVSRVTPAVSKVTMDQIIYWSSQGIASEEIIARIQKSGSTFILIDDDIAYLERQGVRPSVIKAMQEAR